DPVFRRAAPPRYGKPSYRSLQLWPGGGALSGQADGASTVVFRRFQPRRRACQREQGSLWFTYMNLVQDMKLSPTSAVKSLDRGLDILEYVAGCPEPPSFSQLLNSLGIPRSSLFHLLTNLLSRNFLERDPKTERYRVGAEIIEIARKVQR